MFGPLRARRGQEALELGSPGQKALLALLLLDPGRVVPVDRIIDSLWGESPPERARETLRVYVSRLRKVLEAPGAATGTVLVTERPGYRLTVDREAVDIHRFTRLVAEGRSAAQAGELKAARDSLAEALALCSGSPLVDFAYEDSAIPEIRRLEELRLQALEGRIDADLALGRSAEIVPELYGLTRSHPYRERLWFQLMTALYRSARQPDALTAYKSADEALAELGLEPSPELRDLEDRILRRDPALVPPVLTNVPVPLDSFIGRRRELETLQHLVSQNRLVTITGAGGSGKTRLAIEWARGHLERFPEGVWMVDLAPVVTRSQMIAVVISALRIEQRFRTSPADAVANYLADKEALLVLDNCEHLVDAVATLAEHLLDRCPKLVVLVTSREPLRIAGEAIYTVPPLDAPELDDLAGAADPTGSEAEQLFVDRAQAASPELTFGNDAAAVIAQIVARLDGLPLAIELAAVKARTMSVTEIASGLDDAIGALAPGLRSYLPRHRTLKAALDWSNRLLTPDERLLFQRLGVLTGDFSTDAAVALSTGNGRDAVSTHLVMGALVEKSMLTRTAEGRYRLFEPIRQYAVTQLLEAGEKDAVMLRRDLHFADLARVLTEGRGHAWAAEWQIRFEVDRLHFGTAIEGFLSRGDPDRAAEIGAAASVYWTLLGRYAEGRSYLDAVVAVDSGAEPQVRSRLRISLGFLYLHQGDYAAFRRLADEGISLAERESLTVDVGRWLNLMGVLHAQQGNMAAAEAMCSQALELFEEHQPKMAYPMLMNLGASAAWSDELATVQPRVSALRVALDADPDLHLAWGPDLINGIAARMGGDLAEADRLLGRAAKVLRKHRSLWHLATVTVERAAVAFDGGEINRARGLLDEALGLEQEGPIYPRIRGLALGARIALTETNPAAAAELLLEVIDRSAETETIGGFVEVLETAAAMAAEHGDHDAARTFLGAASGLRDELALARSSSERSRAENLAATLGRSPHLAPQNTPDPIDDTINRCRSFLETIAH